MFVMGGGGGEGGGEKVRMYFNYAKLNLLQSRGCGGMLPQESFNVLGYKIRHSELGGLKINCHLI